MDGMTPDFGAIYMEFLNGGAPVTDRGETKEWAENICRVMTEEGEQKR